MGNHEYNLVAWYAQVPGYERPKTSNRPTTDEITRDVQRGGTRWTHVLGFFRKLPLALALPDLRLIHACWHRASLTQVSPVLGREIRSGSPADAVDWLERHVVLRSPFDVAPLERTRLLPGLPGDTADHYAVIPHGDLMKGFEVDAPEPFRDNDGKERKQETEQRPIDRHSCLASWRVPIGLRLSQRLGLTFKKDQHGPAVLGISVPRVLLHLLHDPADRPRSTETRSGTRISEVPVPLA